MSEWIPLMDYAMKKGVSLSTLRRHIKANKVHYRVESGRYLLLDDGSEGLPLVKTEWQTQAKAPQQLQASAATPPASQAPQASQAQASGDFLITQLQIRLKKAQEEIAELKTLIAFYEEPLAQATHHFLDSERLSSNSTRSNG